MAIGIESAIAEGAVMTGTAQDVADGIKERHLLGEPLAKLRVGDQVVLEANHKVVEITGGMYMGEHGVSNFWRWREVEADGSLGAKGCDYGGVFNEDSLVKATEGR